MMDMKNLTPTAKNLLAYLKQMASLETPAEWQEGGKELHRIEEFFLKSDYKIKEIRLHGTSASATIKNAENLAAVIDRLSQEIEHFKVHEGRNAGPGRRRSLLLIFLQSNLTTIRSLLREGVTQEYMCAELTKSLPRGEVTSPEAFKKALRRALK